jgi:WD40 repeat protein
VAFVSSVNSGVAGVYFAMLPRDASISTDLVVRPWQRVSVRAASDIIDSNGGKSDWGRGAIVLQGGSSYRAVGIRLLSALTIEHPQSTSEHYTHILSFNRCELLLSNGIVVPKAATVAMEFRQTTLNVPITSSPFASFVVGIVAHGSLDLTAHELRMGGNVNVGVAVAIGGSFAAPSFDVQMDANHTIYYVFDEERTRYLPPLDGNITYSSGKLIDVFSPIATHQNIDTYKKHRKKTSITSYLTSGDRLASGHEDGTVKIWNVSTGESVATLHTNIATIGDDDMCDNGDRSWRCGAVSSMSFDLSGHILAASIAWDRNDGECRTSEHVTGLKDTVKIWNVSTGERVVTLKAPPDYVFDDFCEFEALSLDPSGDRLAAIQWKSYDSYDSYDCVEHRVTIWSVSTGEWMNSIELGRDCPDTVGHGWVSFSSGDLLVASSFGALHILNVLTGERVAHLSYDDDDDRNSYTYDEWHIRNPLSFDSGGDLVAYGSNDGIVRICHVSKKEIRVVATVVGNAGPVESVSFDPSGGRLAFGSGDGTVKIWDKSTGGTLAAVASHTGSVGSVSFDSTGQYLLSASDDGTVKLWPTPTTIQCATIYNRYELARLETLNLCIVCTLSSSLSGTCPTGEQK